MEPINPSEIYEPATDNWTPGPALTRRRDFHTATPLSDGRVLIAGTALATEADRKSAELFDPSGNGSGSTVDTWNLTGDILRSARRQFTVALNWDAQPEAIEYRVFHDGAVVDSTSATSFNDQARRARNLRGTWTVCVSESHACAEVVLN